MYSNYIPECFQNILHKFKMILNTYADGLGIVTTFSNAYTDGTTVLYN